MGSHYSYTPYIWPSVFTVGLLLALSIYSGRRRSVPGALAFAIGCLLAALWMAGSGLEVAAVDSATKIFWFKFQGAWQLPTVTAVTCFILEYAWPGRWLTRRSLALLSIPPLLLLGLVLTNDLHHLMWRGFAYDETVTPLRGLGNWFFVALAYGLAILSIIVFAWLFIRSPQHRWPVVVMLAGMFGAGVLYLLQAAQVLQSDLSLNVLAMALAYLTFAIALFGFHILDPIPLARQTLTGQMREGVLVLDPQGRVAGLNPAAERILGGSARHLKGQPVSELLPAYSEGHLDDNGETEIELSLGNGPETRDYLVEASALKDWRGLAVGRLLLLRDVTCQKQAQAQIVEHLRQLAILQERERLARELHDSLGQTLAAAHLQASAARLLLAQGETIQTDECLECLADMTISAESDVREYLLGAKTALSDGLPFFPALRQYLTRFSPQFGLRVELKVPSQLEAHGLGLAVEMQLLRIIQEALSNVRKHACAKKAQVVFTVTGPRAQISILDDGQGFDPGAMAAQQGEGFGLQAMRERAEMLGGVLRVDSAPGQGTCVFVEVPVMRDAGTR